MFAGAFKRLLSMVVMLGLWSCVGCDDGGGDVRPIAPTADPGSVGIAILDANGKPVASPSFGGVLVRFSGLSMDVSRTEALNRDGGGGFSIPARFAILEETPDSDDYRVLIILTPDQETNSLVGRLYLKDRRLLKNVQAQLIDICNGANEQLAGGDYTVALEKP